MVSFIVASARKPLPLSVGRKRRPSYVELPGPRRLRKHPPDLRAVERTAGPVFLSARCNRSPRIYDVGRFDFKRAFRFPAFAGTGSGRHPAMIRTHSRPLALSVMSGKCRRSTRTADSSPSLLNAIRIASAVASSTQNMRHLGTGALIGASGNAVTSTCRLAYQSARLWLG